MFYEIIGETIVHVILNFIGGTLRWIFSSIFRKLTHRPTRKFKEYLTNSDNKDIFKDSPDGCLNIIIGILFIIVLVYLFI